MSNDPTAIAPPLCELCTKPILKDITARSWNDGVAHSWCREIALADTALCEICDKEIEGKDGVIAKHYEGPVHAHCASRSSL